MVLKKQIWFKFQGFLIFKHVEYIHKDWTNTETGKWILNAQFT